MIDHKLQNTELKGIGRLALALLTAINTSCGDGGNSRNIGTGGDGGKRLAINFAGADTANVYWSSNGKSIRVRLKGKEVSRYIVTNRPPLDKLDTGDYVMVADSSGNVSYVHKVTELDEKTREDITRFYNAADDNTP